MLSELRGLGNEDSGNEVYVVWLFARPAGGDEMFISMFAVL